MYRTVEPFIHKKVVILHETDRVFQAARAMRDNRIGCVWVADHHGHFTGVVTDRDLATRVVAEQSAANIRLKDIMTSDIAAVNESSSLDDAIELMAKYGVRRIPVLREIKSGRQKCIGLITLDDLLAAEAIDSSHLRRIIRSQISRRYCAYQQPEASVGYDYLGQLAAALSVDKTKADSVARFVFSSLVQRLNYSAGVQFILQLPPEFQPAMFELPPGPDRSITAQRIAEGIAERLQIVPGGAASCLHKLWDSLSKYGDKEQLRHTLFQLPNEILDLFLVPDSPVRHDFEEWVSR